MEQFSDGLLMGFTQLFTGVLTILGTLGVMLYIDWRIALVVVALTPLSIFVARFIATHTYSMFRVQSETRAEMTSLVEELIGNEHLVRAFGYEARAEERFDRINRDLQRCGVRATFFSSTTNPCTRFVNSLVYASVGILGAFVAIAGGITVGELSVFLNYANQYTKPFNDISDVMTELQNALACAQRVFDLIDETPITPDAPDAVSLPHGAGSVAFEHVRFRYQDDVPLIEDMNLKVEPGQRQLLCIARVMLRRPPILILDEATSSIDTRTEVLVQDAFEELMKGRTSFIVAHRLSTIKNADQILVMKAGNIIERGTHDELLAQGGFYKQLYESQFAKA